MYARHQRLILVMLLGLILCLAGTAGAEEAAVRIVDGGFETAADRLDAGTWKLNGSGKIDTGTAYEGRASAQLLGPNKLRSEWVHSFTMPLVPGRDYVVSAWVRAEKAGSVASLGIRLPNGITRIYRGLGPEDGWQKMEIQFVVPESAPEWIQVVLSGEHDGALWWDQVEVTEAHTVRERLAREWGPRLAQGRPIFTGLVINADGLGVGRGPSPKVYDETGQIVFAGEQASFVQYQERGIVAYANSLEEAISNPRLNLHPDYPLRHPLVIDALDGADRPRTGVVLRRRDVEVLFEALKDYDFLGRFAVVIVADRPF